MKPWREIVNPHKDVLKGTFQQSEFSADLSTVYKGKAKEEYQDPVKFFDRTYITEGMRQLLKTVIKRLTGGGGDPVIELQTNFGGGKTHSLLAVYHLATRNVPTSKLMGVPDLLDDGDLNVKTVPKANCAVIDGISLSPNEFQYKDENVTIHTLWGLLAWQLLGQEGYDMVANSDKAGTSPGKDIIIELLRKAAPCVILMDELVSFFKNFGNNEKSIAGTFDSNTAFIQALTESVKAVDNSVLLASLPQSEIEAGGANGEKALKYLKKYFGRVENIWKPVATDEGFEIVRRRLFERVHDEDSMNAVCEEFMQFYRKNKSDFPSEVQMEGYLDRMKMSYPIHPEVFDRLYKDWSTLEQFQSTRGVLQYMATVIYQLWNDNDQDALIMPGSIPQVKMGAQNAKYLTKNWNPIVEEEIDGDRSAPARLDNKEARFGSIQASRRITRTIFLGSAPDESQEISGRQRPVRGLRREQILLGCAVPKQTLSTYDDALARLRNQLHYLFSNGTQFWFDTRPNLKREMEYRKDKVEAYTRDKKLRDFAKKMFVKDRYLTVYIFPNNDEIPEWDQDGLQLVILPPHVDYTYDSHNSRNLNERIRNILEFRGAQRRSRCNRLIFLVPGSFTVVKQLLDSCNTLLAWEEIQKDFRENRINLDNYQSREVNNELEQTRKRLENDFRSCYTCVLLPKEGKPNQVDFTFIRLETGAFSEPIVPRISSKMVKSEDIIEKWHPEALFEHIKEFYFSKGKQTLSIGTLWEDFCKYYFHPRLYSLGVLQDAISEGVEKRLFGYAASQTENDFNSFKFGDRPMFVDRNAIIIAPETAFEYERKLQPAPAPEPPGNPRPVPKPAPGSNNEREFTNFYATTSIDSVGGAQRFQEILDELVYQLNKQPGASVQLTLSISASSQTPFEKEIVRIVKENCNSMGINGDFDN